MKLSGVVERDEHEASVRSACENARLPERSAFSWLLRAALPLISPHRLVRAWNNWRDADIASRYEGCRWCDSVERKLNHDLTSEHAFNPYREHNR
jgi:hypothetical protein